MHILIADDDKDARDLFSEAIRICSHSPHEFERLVAVEEYLSKLENPADVLYLDNHFRERSGGGPGIAKIKSFRKLRPRLDIVITTGQAVTPDLVAEIVQERVGFLPKPTIGTGRIEADVSQRVARLVEEEERRRALFEDVQRACDEGREGVLRLLAFFGAGRKGPKIELLGFQSLREQVIIPRFELLTTVHVGQEVELEQEIERTVATSIRASTEFGLGLSMSESAKFLATAVGLQLKSQLLAKVGVEESAIYRGKYRRGEKLSLSTEDRAADIRKREYYWGLRYETWEATLRLGCERCGSTQDAKLRIYMPVGIVEESAAFDKYGRNVEDGRENHKIVQ